MVSPISHLQVTNKSKPKTNQITGMGDWTEYSKTGIRRATCDPASLSWFYL